MSFGCDLILPALLSFQHFMECIFLIMQDVALLLQQTIYQFLVNSSEFADWELVTP